MIMMMMMMIAVMTGGSFDVDRMYPDVFANQNHNWTRDIHSLFTVEHKLGYYWTGI